MKDKICKGIFLWIKDKILFNYFVENFWSRTSSTSRWAGSSRQSSIFGLWCRLVSRVWATLVHLMIIFYCSYFILFFFHCVSLSTLFISPFCVSFYFPSIFSLWEFFISVCATIPLISSVNILFKQWDGEWNFLFFFDIHQTLFLFKNTNLVQIVRSLLFLIFHLLPCLERPCPRSHPSGSWGMLII